MRDNDLLIYGLLFLVIVGFNVFKQFLAARAEQRRRQQQAAAAQGMPQPDPEADPFTLIESDWGRPPEVEPVPVPEMRPVLASARKPDSARSQSGPAIGAIRPPKPSERRRARHHLFQHRRALREGIVMMTVLGPCRALQPYDQDHS